MTRPARMFATLTFSLGTLAAATAVADSAKSTSPSTIAQAQTLGAKIGLDRVYLAGLSRGVAFRYDEKVAKGLLRVATASRNSAVYRSLFVNADTQRVVRPSIADLNAYVSALQIARAEQGFWRTAGSSFAVLVRARPHALNIVPSVDDEVLRGKEQP